MIFYTSEESRTLRTAVYGAMVLVSHADPGPVDQERFAGIRAMVNLSRELRDVLGAARHTLPDEPELEEAVLGALRRSAQILAAKAPEEAKTFPEAVLAICREVASVDGAVVDAEDVVLKKIETALTG